MATLPDGKNRYRIVSAIDFGRDGVIDYDESNVLGIANSSTGNQALLVAGVPTGANSQLFRQQVVSGQSYVFLRNCNGGKALEMYRAVTADMTNPKQFTYNQSAAQRWWLEDTGETITVNGTSYALYYIRSMSATGKLLTAYEDSDEVLINPEGYPRGSAHDGYTPPIEQQMWYFVKDSLRYNFAAPSSGGANTAQVGKSAYTVLQALSGSLWPSFVGDGATYQCRYRKRLREAQSASDELSEWSDWMSYDSGSTDNLGWGPNASTAANMTTTKDGNRRLATTSIVMDTIGDTYDRCDYEIQVRRFEPNYKNEPRHGGASSFVVSQVVPLQITSLTATWSPDGVILSWESNWERGGATVVLNSQDGLFSKVTVTPSFGDDDALVPNSRLGRDVSVGDVIYVKADMTTPDGATATTTQALTVQYEGTIGDNLTLAATADGSLATVTPSSLSAKGWLVVRKLGGDRFVPLTGSAPWVVAPPLGVPWRVYATVNINGIWNAKMQEFPAITESPRVYHLTSQGLDHDLQVAARKEGFSVSDSRSSSSIEVEGGTYTVNTLGSIVESKMSLKGAIVDWHTDADPVEEYESLKALGRCYLRGPQGYWAQAHIESMSRNATGDFMQDFSASLEEEEW